MYKRGHYQSAVFLGTRYCTKTQLYHQGFITSLVLVKLNHILWRKLSSIKYIYIACCPVAALPQLYLLRKSPLSQRASLQENHTGTVFPVVTLASVFSLAVLYHPDPVVLTGGCFSSGVIGHTESNRATAICTSIGSFTLLSWANLRLGCMLSEVCLLCLQAGCGSAL